MAKSTRIGQIELARKQREHVLLQVERLYRTASNMYDRIATASAEETKFEDLSAALERTVDGSEFFNDYVKVLNAKIAAVVNAEKGRRVASALSGKITFRLVHNEIIQVTSAGGLDVLVAVQPDEWLSDPIRIVETVYSDHCFHTHFKEEVYKWFARWLKVQIIETIRHDASTQGTDCDEKFVYQWLSPEHIHVNVYAFTTIFCPTQSSVNNLRRVFYKAMRV